MILLPRNIYWMAPQLRARGGLESRKLKHCIFSLCAIIFFEAFKFCHKIYKTHYTTRIHKMLSLLKLGQAGEGSSAKRVDWLWGSRRRGIPVLMDFCEVALRSRKWIDRNDQLLACIFTLKKQSWLFQRIFSKSVMVKGIGWWARSLCDPPPKCRTWPWQFCIQRENPSPNRRLRLWNRR